MLASMAEREESQTKFKSEELAHADEGTEKDRN
jgi:hypothetical protein